jgi:hypothetical protein
MMKKTSTRERERRIVLMPLVNMILGDDQK